MEFKSLVPRREKSHSPATRDEFFEPFETFRREMDRMFDDLFNNFGRRSLGLPAGGWQGVAAAIDVTETDKELVVTAELPGLDQKDLEVTLTGDVIAIKGEKKAEQEQKDGDHYYMERRFGAFSRAVRLPFEVKDENVQAKYDKGVLTIRVPKPAEAQRAPRRIDVRAT
jgi:HSP20 family protein